MTKKFAGTVSVQIENYLKKFLDKAAHRFYEMRVILRASEDTTFTSLASKTPAGTVVDLRVAETANISDVINKQTNLCIADIFESFIDFMNDLLTILIVQNEGGIIVSRPLNGEAEIQDYVNEYMERKMKDVVKDRRYDVPKKISVLTPDYEVSNFLNALNSVRISVRHYDGIAKDDITLEYSFLDLLVGQSTIQSLPIMVDAGENIGIRLSTKTIMFRKDEKLSFNEQEVQSILFTLQSISGPSLARTVQKVISK